MAANAENAQLFFVYRLFSYFCEKFLKIDEICGIIYAQNKIQDFDRFDTD